MQLTLGPHLRSPAVGRGRGPFNGSAPLVQLCQGGHPGGRSGGAGHGGSGAVAARQAAAVPLRRRRAAKHRGSRRPRRGSGRPWGGPGTAAFVRIGVRGRPCIHACPCVKFRPCGKLLHVRRGLGSVGSVDVHFHVRGQCRRARDNLELWWRQGRSRHRDAAGRAERRPRWRASRDQGDGGSGRGEMHMHLCLEGPCMVQCSRRWSAAIVCTLRISAPDGLRVSSILMSPHVSAST